MIHTSINNSVIPTVLWRCQGVATLLTPWFIRSNPSQGGTAVDKALTPDHQQMASQGGQFILGRKDIPADPNAYAYRDPRRVGGRWSIYFNDRETKERHRFVLKDGNGNYPPPTIAGQEEAWMLGISKYVELKGKSDRGEAIRSLTWEEMTKKFLLKERRRISDIPNNGITKARFRLLTTQVRWLSDYVSNQKKPVHRFRRKNF